MTGCCTQKWILMLFIEMLRCAGPGFAQGMQRPPITGIAFVQLQVSNVQKATIFYHSLMGFHLNGVGATTNNQYHLFTIPVNYRQSVQLTDGLSASQDERLLLLAFQTTDADALRLYLQSKGIAVPAAVSKEKGMLFFTITDPDKHPVRFIQYLAIVKEQTLKTPAVATVSGRILHAGLTITNAAAANAFYVDVLGFSEIWRGGVNDTVTSWINMRVPEGTDYLEYMLVNGPVNRQQLGSMHHIALLVPDMQAAVDWLGIRSQTTGYPVAAPRIGRNKRWQLNLFDPDGTRIELMEPFTMR